MARTTDPASTPAPAPTPKGPSSAPNATILRVLTFTQNTSALVFSIFVPLHLASPIAAAFGGLGAANKVMSITREYYLPHERLVIYAPLALHICSSALKRLYITYHTGRLRIPSTSRLHILSGYLLIPLLVPHILTHRIIPSSPTGPIYGLSPSEFSYDYTGWALGGSASHGAAAALAWANYLALVGVAVVHAGIGMMKVVSWTKRLARRGRGTVPPPAAPQETAGVRRNGDGTIITRRRRIGLRGLIAGLVGLVAVGLVRIRMDVSRGGLSVVSIRRYVAIMERFWTGQIR